VAGDGVTVTVRTTPLATETVKLPTTVGVASDLAVMTDVPGATPPTTPVVLTVATPPALVDQLTDWEAPASADTAADNCAEPPTMSDVGPVTTMLRTTGATVTDALPLMFGLPTDVAVIVADPNPTADTSPEELTVATFVLPDDQLTVVDAPPSTLTAALNCALAPIVRFDSPLTVTLRTTGVGVDGPPPHPIP
jgi:hypothetical protein